MRHATVRIGEYTLPLIGIPQDATKEQCDACENRFYIGDIFFTGNRFLCPACLKELWHYTGYTPYGK